MDVYLDDRPFAPPQPADTVAQVIEQARASMDTSRVILSILCDGFDVTGDELAQTLAQPADRYDRLDLQTGPSHVLVEEALSQALVVLEQTDSTRHQVAEWLTQGDTYQASEGLAQCFHNWGQVHTAIVQSFTLLGIRVDRMLIQDERIATVLGEITERLQQVKDALNAGDQVLLADQLQYEFDQATDRWRGTILAILEQIEHPSPDLIDRSATPKPD